MRILRCVSLMVLILTTIFVSIPTNPPATAQDNETIKPIVTLGEYGGLTDIAWSPDGSILAASTYVGIVLYDKSLNEIGFLEATSDLHFAGKLFWSPDGKYLSATNGPIRFYPYNPSASLVWSDELYIWDVSSQKIAQNIVLDENSHVYSQDWNKAGTQLAVMLITEDEISQLMLWDAQTGSIQDLDIAGLDLPSNTLWTWADDEQSLETIVDMEKISISVSDASAITRMSIGEPPAKITFTSPNEQHEAIISEGVLVLTNASGDTFALEDADDNHFTRFTELTWSGDSNRAVAWGDKVIPNLRVIDVLTGETLFEFNHDQIGMIVSAKLNADGSALAIRTIRHELLVYDFATETWEQRWSIGGYSGISFNPDGTKIATVNGFSHQIYIWDALTSEELDVWEMPNLPSAERDYILTMAWSPDGQYIATGSYNTSEGGFRESLPIDLFIWSTETGQIIQTVPALAYAGYGFVSDVEWSADSQIVTYRTNSGDISWSHIGAYNVQIQELLFQTPTEWQVYDIALHPSGKVLALSRIYAQEPPYSTVVFVDITTGTFLDEITLAPNDFCNVSDNFCVLIEWHPSGDYLTTRSDHSPIMQIWEWQEDETPQLYMEFDLINYVRRGRFKWNDQGSHLMIFYRGDSFLDSAGVQIWDVDLANKSATLTGLFTNDDPSYFIPRSTVGQWTGQRMASILRRMFPHFPRVFGNFQPTNNTKWET